MFPAAPLPELLSNECGASDTSASTHSASLIADTPSLPVRTPAAGLERWYGSTPADLVSLGYVYVPAAEAPSDLLCCLDDTQHSLRVSEKYWGQEVVYLVGGLNGSVRYQGAALVPRGKEPSARVAQILASGQMLDLSDAFFALGEFAEAVTNS